MAKKPKTPTLEDLKPAPHNARGIGQAALDALGVSMAEFGDVAGITWNRRTGHLVAGHQRLRSLREKHGDELRMARGIIRTPDGETFRVRVVDWPLAKEKAATIAANSPELAGVFTKDVAEVLAELEGTMPELSADLRFDELLKSVGLVAPRELDDAAAGEKPKRPTTKPGDLYTLGRHRLLCDDTRDAGAVRKLLGRRRPVMIHADPPYGMGKEADGVTNDNLYREKLDAFQVEWLDVWLARAVDVASLYVWGNAEDLWRLWWCSGIRDAGDLMVRNELVWDKGSAFGMASEGQHCYPPATERCLFIMRGQQFLGNVNKADFWPGWQPLLDWLVEQRDAAGWSNPDVNEITGTSMAGHWFTRSQFQPIARAHYTTLQEAAEGRAFVEPYDELFGRLFPGLKDAGNAHRELSARVREQRTYFDNAHAVMTDVWRFERVAGADRFGHATPKPVPMVARAMLSSSAPGDVVGVPFAGTGPELVAGEQLGRVVCAMEVEPGWCDVVVDRWQELTGKKAKRRRA